MAHDRVTKRTIVCLANSRKYNGHCVAGKEIIDGAPGAWVRPCSARATGELTWAERAYTGMVDPAILDIIEVPLSAHRPESYQVENYIIAKDVRWVRVGALTHAHLAPFADVPESLWSNGTSSRAGLNDRVDVAQAHRHRASLYLLHLPRIVVRSGVMAVSHGQPKRKVYTCFEYNGAEYALPMTDPHVEKTYLARQNGDYAVEDAFLTVSLGEPFEGYCYKLAAALITH